MPEYKEKDTAFYRGKQAYKFDFSASAISSDGAILLSEKVERKSGLLKSFATLIPDHRNPFYISYTYEHMLRQRVFLMMQGYQDCNDEEKLREDPIIRKVLNNELCSQPTLSRFENKADRHLVYRMCQWFVDRYAEGLDKHQARIIIDVDGTDDPTHGCQQLSMFNGYYGQTMYHELFFKDGQTGQVILPVLRPGNCHSNKWFVGILKRVVKKIREKLPDVKILIRADSGFSGAAFYQLADQLDLYFCLGISSNEVLKRFTRDTVTDVKETYASKRIKHQEFVGPYHYQAQSWGKPEKLYAKVESTGKGMNIRYFVSNFDQMEARDIYFDFYVKRGDTSENRIKELKNMTYADRLSCHEFWANFLRLMISTLCYEMFRQIKLLIAKTKHHFAKCWQIDNIRLYLMKVGACLKERKRSVTIQFSKAFRYQYLLGDLLCRC
ncbi:MAG: IS1380 family transposase [Cyclobacteriaceae bacterium]|nr:IS1380 family transposase [Cyclobacteriaceae bacterium]MCK5470869.1 IS1380 family transposase [Cyclobacteriaceae bacterium]